MNKEKRYKGYTVLTSVLVVGAVVITLSLGGVFLSTLNLKSGLSIEQTFKAYSLAQACAELALEEIRLDNAFTGTQIESISGDNCNFEVIDLGGEVRQVNAEAIFGDSVSRIQIETIQLSPSITIDSWQEVANF